MTPRERQVLALITKGYTNRAIADALVIAERSSEIHVSTILGKLGVTCRTQATTLGAPMWPAERVEYERHMARVRMAFSEAALQAVLAEGGGMTLLK